MSDFTEYVERQQALRYPNRAPVGAAATAPVTAQPTVNDVGHADLDDILDSLDLAESTPRVPMRELLLGTEDETKLDTYVDSVSKSAFVA